MTFIISKWNEEILFEGETEQEVKDKALAGYDLEVSEYTGELVEFEGALHTAEYKARVEAERAEQAKQARIAELKKQLDAIDLRSIRAIRASETERIAQYEAQAQELRAELQELMNETQQ